MSFLRRLLWTVQDMIFDGVLGETDEPQEGALADGLVHQFAFLRSSLDGAEFQKLNTGC